MNFDGDVHVKGCLSEGRAMELTGCLTVGGAIEAVDLKAGGSVNAKGGVIGKTKGKYSIGGDLRCRFITGGTVTAAANIHVQSEVINSQIVCGGRLVVLNGPITGGNVAANGGIACKVLGHPNGTPTVVEAGSHKVLESMVGATQKQIEANHKRISTVRAQIEPLMRQQKLLTAQQKEKATELLFEAGELEEKTIAMAKGLEDQARVMKEKECAEIVVEEVAHPGVIVRLSGFETVISAAFKGPFKLTLRKLGGVTQIVLVDEVDKTASPLPTHHLFEEHAQAAASAPSSKAA